MGGEKGDEAVEEAVEEKVEEMKEEKEEEEKARVAEEEDKKKKAAEKKVEEEEEMKKKKKEELVPKWRDPMTGAVVDVDKRKEYLKKSKPFRECWEGVLAKCVQDLGKTELERRVAAVSKGAGRIATPSMGFCALAECNGVVQHAITKLQLPGYRDEMSLAEEVCQTSQYVKVSRKEKKSPRARVTLRVPRTRGKVAARAKLRKRRGPQARRRRRGTRVRSGETP